MAASMAAMPGTEMATYEDDDTRLDFDVESDLSRFLSLVPQRTDQISQSKVDDKIVNCSILLLSIKRYVCFVCSETAVRILTLMTKKP